jgi:hypothetical protein
MLYKVTPMMPQAGAAKAKKVKDPTATPRKRRKTGIYDHEGHEVLITLMCLKCRQVKPLAQFGLRKMADGAIRNQPWCRTCRSGAGTKPAKGKAADETASVEALPTAAEPSASPAVEPVTAEAEETTQPRAEATAL